MATKIRLQRHGRKGQPIYHLVVTDSRKKRDGKATERLGLVNANVHPRKVELDFDRALAWVKNGAEMSDTARSILSAEGVLMKKHLDAGVGKGAFDQAEADKRFEAWLADKNKKADAAAKSLSDATEADKKKRLEAETKVKEERAKVLAAKEAELNAEAEAAVAEESAEAVAEEPQAEATPAEEAPVEEPKAEAEEAPAEEEKKD
jgi:small subunit ribosomal protein S16